MVGPGSIRAGWSIDAFQQRILDQCTLKKLILEDDSR